MTMMRVAGAIIILAHVAAAFRAVPGACRPGHVAPRASASSVSNKHGLRPVVLCPAQFGTAADYDTLKADLRSRGFDLYPAPLRRFDWLRIVPATLTIDFLKASLKPAKTLGFFYEALDKAFAQVEADYGANVKVAVLGHSIGGWVARSYLGEVLGAEEASRRVCSLVTLGTPHNPPPKDSPVAALDQTRGLLTYINEEFPAGAPLPPSAVTCVAGKGTKAPESVGALLEVAQYSALACCRSALMTRSTNDRMRLT